MPERRADRSSRLARLRVPLGFVFAVARAVARAADAAVARCGAALSRWLGEALRIWAAGHLNKSREVTTSGPYRWLAHPLYVGSSVMGVGLAIASDSVVVAARRSRSILASTITAAVRSEEAFLRGTFGDDYDRYRRGGAARSRATRRFSLAQAIANREHRARRRVLLAGACCCSS